MLEKLKTWFSHVISEPDNKTHCIFRWMILIGFVYAIGTHAYTIFWQHAAFDLKEFFTAWAYGLGGSGLADMLKKTSPIKEE